MVNSICRKVCEYDSEGSHRSDKEKTCRGCGRTAEEITEWYYATRERKIEIAKAAKERTKARKEADRQRTMISLDLI